MNFRAHPAGEPALPATYEEGGARNGQGDSGPQGSPESPTAQRAAGRRLPLRLTLLALAIVFAGAGAGVGTAFLVPPTHAARAEILYPITEEQPTGFLREDRNLTTQLVYLRSHAVLGPVAQERGMSVNELERNVTVSLLDSSELIRIEVTDRSHRRALGALTSIVSTYLANDRQAPESEALDYVESELSDVRAELDQLTSELDELREERAGGADVAAEIAGIAAEREAKIEREQSLRSELDSIRLVRLSGPYAELTTEPYALPDPVSPGPVTLAATGALTGSVIAAGVVALVLRRRART
ncbi:hypothetical protein [Haloechinothrix sp. LS1_15]|uniref:hypothetical protein n=1 Tax=Haloechinothrix sp. LS1_15 TaxID=2652248 RepID=UPI002944EE9C|nr:hypothetical protein [Haloechinothrix sp. LS1_15]MDV6011229.1 hypothetical protein [Haloechinothrix sp. LS1_15]